MYYLRIVITGIILFSVSACTTKSTPLPVPNSATNTPTVSASPVPTETASPRVTPNPTKKTSPTAKPTVKSSASAQVKSVSEIRFEPSSIKLSKKRSELTSLPAVHVYYPGTHTVSILPLDGTVGIWASIFPGTTPTAEGKITDIGIVNIHFDSSFDRGIKSGLNKETLTLREGDILAAFNNPILARLSVEITVTD